MDKPSPPPAPDYKAAAEQQGQNSLELAKLTNANVVSPYGSQTYYSYGTDPNAYRTSLERQISDLQAKMPEWSTGDQSWRVQFNDGQPYGSERLAQWFTNTREQLGGQITDLQRKLEDFNKTGLVPSDAERPTLVQKFSPEQQALYDQQVKIKQLLGGLGIQGANALGDVVGKNLDLSGLPAAPGSADATRQKVYDAMMSRVTEDDARRRDDMNSNMVAAGHRAGSKAYDDQMNLADRQYNDARQQAILASGQEAQRDFGMDTQRRAQALSELLTSRQTPLNEINALLSGSQVSNPFAMPGYAPPNAQGTPYMQAAQLASDYNTDLYNAQAAQAGGVNSGLFGLGSAAIIGGIAL